jgi:hypothetical protein
VFVTALVLTLYGLADKIVHEPGSFLRVYRKNAAIMSNSIELPYNSYYIAGTDDEHIYLGNLVNPRLMIVTNLTLTDSQHVTLNFRGLGDKPVYKSSKIKIRSPYFYYTDGITPCLLRGKIGEWTADKFMYDSSYFDQVELISPYSFAIRTHKAGSLENILGKVKSTKPYNALASDLLQKQIDGVFCTDGMLRYNETLDKLIYTYYYRNEYIVYDTNLNLGYRGHTIDTISKAQIVSKYVPSTNSLTLGQKKVTNKDVCTSGNYLFVSSNLLAKNDFRVMYDVMSIVDMYDLRNNKYVFSFSVPAFNVTNAKFREFNIVDNRILLAVYDKYLVKYDLQTNYFNELL